MNRKKRNQMRTRKKENFDQYRTANTVCNEVILSHSNNNIRQCFFFFFFFFFFSVSSCHYLQHPNPSNYTEYANNRRRGKRWKKDRFFSLSLFFYLFVKNTNHVYNSFIYICVLKYEDDWK